MAEVRKLFLDLEAELNQHVFERREVVRGLITALLASEENAPVPMVMIGPGGTSKTMAAKAICRAVDGKFFSKLFTAFTTPEEFFGVYSPKKMIDEERMVRNPEGMAPMADVVYADEIFNSNSPMLNAMNDVLAEGVWTNGAGQESMRMKLFVASSNRVPDTLGEQPELAALWDRFVLRYLVNYLQDSSNVKEMLRAVVDRRRAKQGSSLALRTRISLDDLEKAKAKVRSVDVEPILDLLLEVWATARTEALPLSDRRLGQLLSVIQVQAFLAGRNQAESSDLAILRHCLWDKPNQARDVQLLIMGLLTPWFNELQEYADEAEEIIREFRRMPEDDQRFLALGTESNVKLKELRKKVEELGLIEKGRSGEVPVEITEVYDRINGYNKEVMAKVMGI